MTWAAASLIHRDYKKENNKKKTNQRTSFHQFRFKALSGSPLLQILSLNIWNLAKFAYMFHFSFKTWHHAWGVSHSHSQRGRVSCLALAKPPERLPQCLHQRELQVHHDVQNGLRERGKLLFTHIRSRRCLYFKYNQEIKIRFIV